MPLEVPDVANTLTGNESLELPEFGAPPADPLGLLDRWLGIAAEHDVREPLAVALATVDAQGHPASRIVLVKEITDGAVHFSTHVRSRKGQHLAGTPFASVTFYWRETLQQITAAGPVEMLSDGRSTALFAERPLAAQATTAVSHQSQPLDHEHLLHQQAAKLIDLGKPVPRPDGWAGYRLVPNRIEFWQGRASRLHRRLEYTRNGPTSASQHLQP
jgi:pyridoxamine-phosphate oxidase